MSEHTPGPWVAEQTAVFSDNDDLPEGRVFGYGFGDNGFICDLDDGEYHEYDSRAEMEANARLIAAAPELLEVCEIIDWHESGWESPEETLFKWTQLARAAIAKARGEG